MIKEIKKYVIWHPEKVCSLSGTYPKSYEELKAIEEKTSYSYSSVVKTDDIEELINGVHNETDICLEYYQLPSISKAAA